MANNREISQFASFLTVDESANNNVGIATTVRISAGGLYVDGVEVIGPGGAWRGPNSGLVGAQGAQGAPGAQGAQGADGAQGNQGYQGRQGTVGAQGTQGAPGAQGAQGTPGSPGAQGAQGYQGRQGAQGQPAAGANGKILQVVSVVKTDTYVSSVSSTATLITGMQASITPSSTSSKILIILCLSATNGDSYSGHHGILKRNGTTDICIGNASNSNNRATFSFQPPNFLDPNATSAGPGGQTIVFLDSPSTTSSTTYGLYHRDTSGGGDTLWVNRNRDNGTGTEHNRTASTITLMEVSA